MGQKRDLTNMRFGRLTVTGPAGEGLWMCRCSCGSSVTVGEPYLTSGVTTSCGCARGRALDLTGRRYGQLTVLEPAQGRAPDHSILWRCRCDCGRETVVSSGKLRSGHTGSCGCQKMARINDGKTYVDGSCLEILLSDRINANNSSGHRGVARRRDKWQAYITYRGRMYWLGTHDRYEDAVKARETAEQQIRSHIDGLLSPVTAKAGEPA